jgi:hypothetical protein
VQLKRKLSKKGEKVINMQAKFYCGMCKTCSDGMKLKKLKKGKLLQYFCWTLANGYDLNNELKKC